MADSGGTDIVAGMAAVPAAGSGISDAQLYITGTGGIRGRPSASDGWNLAGIWADVRRSDAGTHSLFGTLRSSSDAEENTETGFYTAGAVSAAWICGEVRNALKVKMIKASITDLIRMKMVTSILEKFQLTNQLNSMDLEKFFTKIILSIKENLEKIRDMEREYF